MTVLVFGYSLSGRLAYGHTQTYEYSKTPDIVIESPVKRYIYLLDFQKIEKRDYSGTYNCLLAGDHVENWAFNTSDYQFEFVRFIE